MKIDNLLDDLVELVDKQSELIFESLDSKQIGEIKAILLNRKFELNPTKRKLVEILEDKLASKVNELKISRKEV